MVSMHQRAFAADEVGSVFCTQVEMPCRAVGVEFTR